MKDDTYQLIGLLGFILAGLIFVWIGIRGADMLTVIASIIWTLSCLVWIIPLLRRK